MRQVAPRRDPAPSRAAYRLHRLWLTPIFRALLRIGVPTFVFVFSAGAYLSDPENRVELAETVIDLRRSIQERPEFMVQMLAIDGASTDVADDIHEVLAVDFPISSFDLDLVAMRQAVEGLDAVAEAELRIRPGGILNIEVAERQPVAVWRSRQGLDLVDAEGQRVAELHARSERSDLPLIAGQGASDRVAEALAIFAAAEPIADRIRGLLRVGERRWTVVLDRGQQIHLPERDPIAALEQVIALDHAQDLLARDISVVDMRNVRRPTVRINSAALDGLRQVRSVHEGGVVR